MSKGVDINLKNKDNKTAYDLASLFPRQYQDVSDAIELIKPATTGGKKKLVVKSLRVS